MFWNIITHIIIIFYILICNLFLWRQSWEFSEVIIPVFSVTQSFRNQFNMLICWSINNCLIFFSRFLWFISLSFKKNTEIFYNIINVFTVTFNRFNVFLQNTKFFPMLQVPPPETRGQITVNTVNTGNKEKKRESRLLSASSSVCVYCYIHLHNLINNCCLNIKNKAFKILFHFLLLKLLYVVSFSKSIQAHVMLFVQTLK